MAVAYYNEWDTYAAQWLRNLIDARLIAWGVVDTRSIADVRPAELTGFTQCHFFAGIGGWSLAARLAGWPDDRSLWTGSCPCQPFSVAGKGEAQADKRHLWPELFRLVRERCPPVLMGEQVAAAVGKSWLDGVCVDLESVGYTVGAAVVPACAVDAPHRRDRLWFVADRATPGQGRRGILRPGQGQCEIDERASSEFAGPLRRHVAHSHSGSRQVDTDAGGCTDGSSARQVTGPCGPCDCTLAHVHEPFASDGQVQRIRTECRPSGDTAARPCHVGDGDGEGSQVGHGEPRDARAKLPAVVGTGGSDCALADCRCGRCGGPCERQAQLARGAEVVGTGRSPWQDSQWITGADGKARRVKPGIRLLAHGVSGRVAVVRPDEQGESALHWYNRIGALRAFGNAIVPEVAAEIIGAYMDCAP